MNAITEPTELGAMIPHCISKVSHYVKVWPIYFLMLEERRKTAEIRRNDRGYKVGDIIEFAEWEPDRERYTGRLLQKKVTCITQTTGLCDGYVMLSLGDLDFPEPFFKNCNL